MHVAFVTSFSEELLKFGTGPPVSKYLVRRHSLLTSRPAGARAVQERATRRDGQAPAQAAMDDVLRVSFQEHISACFLERKVLELPVLFRRGGAG